jgi:hypothetical protein
VFVAYQLGVEAFALAGCGQPACSPIWTNNFTPKGGYNGVALVSDGTLYVQSSYGLFAFAA